MSLAAYDPESDCWSSMPPIPAGIASTGIRNGLSLYPMDAALLAVSTPGAGDGRLKASILDVETQAWTGPWAGPLSGAAGTGIWTGDRVVFLTGTDDAGDDLDGTFDPVAGGWDVLTPACAIDTTDGVWTGTSIINVYQGLGFDPGTGQCFTIPEPPRRLLGRSVQEWTGRDLIIWSGNPGLLSTPTRAGQAYRPGL